ncbi:MAG: saccharopine dehydrogenase C-terminal domain-containing protein [Acidimicrobiales bacterium]
MSVAPRGVVAARLPDPAHLGDLMTGKTCAGTWVKGTKDGQPRWVYLYQVADNATTMRDYDVQAVVWQTAVGPVIAMELLAEGLWKDAGVPGPEAFDPDPFMERMDAYGAPYSIRDQPPVTEADTSEVF